MDRRGFLGSAAMAAFAASASTGASALPAPPISSWPAATPISREERMERIERARALMRKNGMKALLIEPGSSMVYFTGVRWRTSERITMAILPVEGDACIVCPHFEEPSVRETFGVPGDIRVWHEDQDPMAIVAGFLKDRKIADGPIGVEERVRFFAIDGLQKNLPHVTVKSGAPIIRGTRMIKTSHEIALMQRANNITLAAMTHAWKNTKAGMTPKDLSLMIAAESRRLGGDADGGLVLIGEAAAYPHGTRQPQVVKEGMAVLLDCGCDVEDYQSDISRTFIFGEPTKRQREVWNQVRDGQAVAFAAAKLGAPCGSVDTAVRSYYEKLGYGPGYKLPGLSHRTGHGIGMDGHEWVNLVRGEMTPLAPGMCFSDEPGLYIPGEFGVRFEDCFHMTETGAKWFTVPPTDIEKPFG